jgi:D-glycero-D-manno-heptose 1,7-bisphosphate phosphatase
LIQSPSLIHTQTRSKALFLDRDGVININHGYVHQIDSFDFIDGIFELVRTAYERDFKIVIITNQSGIGRGLYSEQQFHQLTSWMCKEFRNAGSPIDKVYFSPFHPTEGIGKYKKDDFSRKPNPGMILQAQQELGLDLECSILIGDKASDIEAGIASGLGLNILFAQERPLGFSPQQCCVIDSLLDALPLIHGHSNSPVLK